MSFASRSTRSARCIRLAVALSAVAALVVAATPARAAEGDRATITITFVSDDSDGIAWPRRAKRAFRYAANRWETMVYSPTTIRIQADWDPLAPGHLGSASPSISVANEPGLPRTHTYYPVPLANALAGSDFNGDSPEITAQFNSELTNWYFGTDGSPPAGKFDFVTVVMHELGHGLGFGGFMNYDSVSGEGWWSHRDKIDDPPGIFDRFTVNRDRRKLLRYPDGSTALGRQLTSNGVFWTGANARAYNDGRRPRMYAPEDWAPGTSYGHLNEKTYRAGTRDSLMTPYGSRGEVRHTPGPLVLGMFQDMGWELGRRGRRTVARTLS